MPQLTARRPSMVAPPMPRGLSCTTRVRCGLLVLLAAASVHAGDSMVADSCSAGPGAMCAEPALLQTRMNRGVRTSAGGRSVEDPGSNLTLIRESALVPPPGSCEDSEWARLAPEHLQQSLDIGTRFLLGSQLPEGNFRYEYDWRERKASLEDNSVRQAGTLWALVLLHQESPSPKLAEAVRKGLRYFADKSHEVSGGRRIVRYPGESKGKLGTLALLALSHIDFLDQGVVPEEGAEREELERHLAGYTKQILDAEHPKSHLFHARFRLSDGKPGQKDSPYFDGESLLALIKVATRRRGKEAAGLWKRISAMAKAGYHQVGQALRAEDFDWLKGYYQWSTLAWHELLQTGRPEFAKYGKHMLRYADYIVGKHHGADGKRVNLGVVLEGLFPALLEATVRGDAKRANQIRCFALRSLRGMVGMQVGHSLDDSAKDYDEVAVGGFQGSSSQPKLRIDTTQHSLHSVLQAKRLMDGMALI